MHDEPAMGAIGRRTFLTMMLGAGGAALATALVGTGNASASGRTDDFLASLRSKVGSPYEFGAEGPDRFDCSGLVYWGWRQAGVSVPRTADKQYRAATPVAAGAARPGDSVFFVNASGVAIHTLVVLGGGSFIQASATYAEPDGVVVCSMPFTRNRIVYGRLV